MEETFRVVDTLFKDPDICERWRRLTGGWPPNNGPIYSFDNASCHKEENTLYYLGLIAGLSYDPLPPHSGDLHRVIERVHARLCGKFAAWLYEDSTPRSMPQYCSHLRSLFYETELADIHAADISSINKLYARVVQLAGGRPEAEYR
jgi:hypothetical protein